MFKVLKIKNKILFSLIPIVLISIIGFIEWQTGYQLSFAFSYLLVLCFFALHENIKRSQIIFNAAFAAAVSLIVQVFSNEPFHSNMIPYLNAIINLTVFLLVSFLCYSLNLRQRDLIDLNKNLKKLNIEKNKMLGITAHDLRGPFASIQSMSDLMMLDESNTEKLRFLKMMHSISTNSLRLVDNLLNISQIELGIVKLNIQSHEYIGFIHKTIMFHQLFANNKKINIAFNCTFNELALRYDEVHTEQVISNLVMNAIKYSNPGSEIKIQVSKADAKVLTEIIDEGVGIHEKELGMLFNFFQKTSAKPTSGEKGSGLGLAIAKKIVTTHGGSIGVKSELNKGSNFYFYLPA